MHEDKKLLDVLTGVVEGSTTSIKIVKEMIGNELIGHIKITESPVEPIRAESPAREHCFYDAVGFIAFVNANKTPNTIVLADPMDRQARAIIDDRAEKGFEKIFMQPRYHPKIEKVFKTILSQRDRPVEIKKFAIMVMRCRDLIVGDDKNSASNIAMLMQQIQISSKVKASHGTGKKSTNGLMCQTEVKGELDDGQPVELPDGITVEVPIFVNTDPVRFTIDLTIQASQSEAYVTAESPDLDVKMFEVFSAMLEPIKKMDGVLFSLGVTGVRDWVYVK